MLSRAEQKQAANARWYARNRDGKLAKNHAWTAANKERHRQLGREGTRRLRGYGEDLVHEMVRRSYIMSRISRVSNMEIAAKPLLETMMGCKLVPQGNHLEGKPDYFNEERKLCVFVHGCFFHGHACKDITVKTNRAFWLDKIAHNEARHSTVELLLEASGYEVVVVWECVINRLQKMLARRSRAHLRGLRRERRALK